MSPHVRARLLGPLDVSAGDQPVDIATGKPRTVLVMLLAQPRRAVPVSALVDELWEDGVPRSALPNLRNYVLRLRQVTGLGERLVTCRGGYLLRVEPDELDLARFGALAKAGRDALARTDLATASTLLGRALALWRGSAVADVPRGPALRRLAAHLDEEYLAVTEDHAEVELALGRHAVLVGRLRGLARRYPLRERLHAQLMLASYRGGDTAGAFRTFDDLSRSLTTELRVSPGQEIVRLRQAMERGEVPGPVPA